MSFDPERYAAGIRVANERERKAIDERMQRARSEAQRLAERIKASDSAVRAVYLFGSVAEGSASRIDFDIDLALEGGDTYKALDLTETSDFEVDVVALARLPTHVRERILDRGILLAWRDPQ